MGQRRIGHRLDAAQSVFDITRCGHAAEHNRRIATATIERHTAAVVEHADEPDPSTLLQVSTEPASGAVVVEAAGEVDMLTAPRLDQEIQQAIAQSPPRLVLDLSDVTFLSSAGLALLVRAHKDCGDAVDMRIVAATSATQRPIELMGLHGDLRVHGSRAEALA